MTRVLTVACQIPGGYGEYVRFDSRTSLLDAEFVLFHPTFEGIRHRSSLSKGESEDVWQAITHWKRELVAVLQAGNTVLVMLSDLESVDLNSRTVATNYDVFPSPVRLIESRGNSMVLARNARYLEDYWRQFGAESRYLVYFSQLNSFTPLIAARNSDRIVGAIWRIKGGGALLALPWLDFKRAEFFGDVHQDEFGEVNYDWTPKAMDWGRRYLETLEALDKAITSPNDNAPTPQWARHNALKTNKEISLSTNLLEIQTELSDLERRRQDIESELADAGSLRALLFEKGPALEVAVLEAMRLLGFEANNYRDSDSEFDVVLECSEGRCIGEVEGRDSKAIGIDKLRQLQDNIHYDLSRDEVSEPAKAILFGNAFRLTPPSDRPVEHFTAKCVSAAERTNTALVRTCDLFEVARALVDNPDPNFAASCRKAILNTSGEEVKFPTPQEPGTTN